MLTKCDWRDLQILLAVTEAGSFRAASKQCGVSLNTVRARVDRLESLAGTPLFARTMEGVAPTAEGLKVVAVIRQMKNLARTGGLA